MNNSNMRNKIIGEFRGVCNSIGCWYYNSNVLVMLSGMI